MFRTLFSRMLVTYLSVTLGLMILLGVTVGSMFQQQYMGEKESELRREAEEIADTVVNRYMDDDKRPLAEKELLTIARKYDAMIVLRFAENGPLWMKARRKNGRAARIWMWRSRRSPCLTGRTRAASSPICSRIGWISR